MSTKFNVSEVAANRSSRMIAEIIRKNGMESDTIKNGAGPKSWKSRGNFLKLGMVLVVCYVFANNARGQTSWNISDNSSSGNNVTATLTVSDSILTISGTGNMADFYYSLGGEAPWHSAYRNAIKTVIIDSGVTNIGDRAFKDCGNLKAIGMPNTCTIIGRQAFYNCTSLKSILIQESVLVIEDNRLKNNPHLKLKAMRVRFDRKTAY